MKLQKKIRLILLLLALLLSSGIKAQSVQYSIEKARVFIDDHKYEEAYKVLQGINDEQVEELGDSCVMLYNYEKGACLYYMDKYEEAIPFLQKGLKYMEKLPHEDCNYLEMMFGIGACYKKLGNYDKAEEYFRRTILKGTYFNLNCAIRNQTYSEMAELYTLMGKPEFADVCTSRIESEMRIRNSQIFDNQIDDLYNLYEAYEKQGKIEESINTLKKILHLIDDNKGKVNDDYLLYSSLLGLRLRYNYNRPEEAASIHWEMIEIGKNFKTYRDDICNAYEDYLSYLAENGKVDSIKQILPSAIKYYTSTTNRSRTEVNLYEIIGIGLFEAKEYETAISYLEKEWKGKKACSIRALDCLGSYYFRTNPAKALSYYKDAETQILNGLEVDSQTKQTVFEYLMYLNERLGNPQEAIRYAELAEPFIIDMHDDLYYLRHLVSWATDCINVNDAVKANKLIERAEPLLEKCSNEINIGTYSNMGFVYLKLEKLEKAIAVIDKGIALAIKEKGEKCIELATLYHNLGRAYMLQHDDTNALLYLNKSKDLQIQMNGQAMQRTLDYIKECESK